MRALAALFVVAGVWPANAAAQTDHFGGPLEDYVWEAENGPYRVHAHLVVDDNQTLRIEAGTVVEIGNDDESQLPVAILVRTGALIVAGTAEQPVIFRRLHAEHLWHGIRFDEESAGGTIDHAVFEGAEEALDVRGGLFGIIVRDSVFRHNQTHVRTRIVGRAAIDRSLFTDSTSTSIQATSNQAFTLTNSVVARSAGIGINVIEDDATHQLVNCTVFDTAGTGVKYQTSAAASGTFEVVNTIVSQTGTALAHNAASGSTAIMSVVHAALWANNLVSFGPVYGLSDENVLRSELQFTDPMADDFSLTDYSAGIDQGTMHALSAAAIDGTPRPMGNGVDIGAYERAAAPPVCGNRIVEPGEACDDGNGVENDGCDSECRLPLCGNGIVNSGEDCDDGNVSNTDLCLNTCVLPHCGDGIVNGDEECDAGGAQQSSCSTTCKRVVITPVAEPEAGCNIGPNSTPHAAVQCLLAIPLLLLRRRPGRLRRRTA